LINPYFIYSLSFLAVLVSYFFGWSKLFPDLGWSLLTFLISSIIIAVIIGRTFYKRNLITFNKIKFTTKVEWVTYAILFGYLVEFIYHRNFPLLAVFTKIPLSYHEFGIPTFHVFLVTFNSFFSIYLFQMILSETRQRKYLIIFFISTLVPSLLIMNRGMLVMILISCLFVYLIKYQKQITLRKITGLVAIGLLGLYLFGIAGNVRVNNQYAFELDGVTLEVGEQHLDGREALSYARMRKADPRGDFGRQERQREVVSKVIKKAATFSTLTNYEDLLTALEGNIKTNLTLNDIIGIQAKYKSAANNLEKMEIEGEGQTIKDIWYFIVEEETRQTLSNQLREHLGLPADTVEEIDHY